ncbi:hypothetical protein D9611_000691 [Ephemerocybe angulata]|uniref:Uncharacterized protein n=1 Tax=Ephemerocybe angulata TaxID=980116 RepID=A0A8H5BN67_9AGAR|nr:hypothetical protein D9611_000691 [Tulosesus angulatus]
MSQREPTLLETQPPPLPASTRVAVSSVEAHPAAVAGHGLKLKTTMPELRCEHRRGQSPEGPTQGLSPCLHNLPQALGFSAILAMLSIEDHRSQRPTITMTLCTLLSSRSTQWPLAVAHLPHYHYVHRISAPFKTASVILLFCSCHVKSRLASLHHHRSPFAAPLDHLLQLLNMIQALSRFLAVVFLHRSGGGPLGIGGHALCGLAGSVFLLPRRPLPTAIVFNGLSTTSVLNQPPTNPTVGAAPMVSSENTPTTDPSLVPPSSVLSTPVPPAHMLAMELSTIPIATPSLTVSADTRTLIVPVDAPSLTEFSDTCASTVPIDARASSVSIDAHTSAAPISIRARASAAPICACAQPVPINAHPLTETSDTRASILPMNAHPLTDSADTRASTVPTGTRAL